MEAKLSKREQRMRSILEFADEYCPDEDEDINGGDLVDWFTQEFMPMVWDVLHDRQDRATSTIDSFLTPENILTLKPAYGKDYESEKAVLEDWNAYNMDFHDVDSYFGGEYVNKLDLLNSKYSGIVDLQYAGLTRQLTLTFKDGVQV